eukprot:3713995-Pleurochrysis_carterae.AAC.1
MICFHRVKSEHKVKHDPSGGEVLPNVAISNNVAIPNPVSSPVGDEEAGGRAHLKTRYGASDHRVQGGSAAVAGFEHGRDVACADEAFRA